MASARPCPKCAIPTAWPDGTEEHFRVYHGMAPAEAATRIQEMREMEEAMAAETDTGGKYACKYCHRKDGTHTANCRKPVARKPGAKKVAVKSARPVVSPYGQAIEALRAKRDGIDAAIKELEALG